MLLALPAFMGDYKDILMSILIGGIAGYLAQVIMPGKGFGLISTIIIGIIGGVVGKILLGKYINISSMPIINEIICALIGSILLIIPINLLVTQRRLRDRADRSV